MWARSSKLALSRLTFHYQNKDLDQHLQSWRSAKWNWFNFEQCGPYRKWIGPEIEKSWHYRKWILNKFWQSGHYRAPNLNEEGDVGAKFGRKLNKAGTVGTKFGVGTIGTQIGPSGLYRGWIWSKGGFGSKSGHMVWEWCICLNKVLILCGSGDSRCHHSHTIWPLFSNISNPPTLYCHFGQNDHTIVR